MILALSHDYIVMRNNRGFLYMSELDLGLKIPRWFMAVIRGKIGRPGDRRDVLLAAEKVTAGRGREIRVVDEACDGAEETIAGAMRMTEGVIGCGEAYGERREVMREALEAIGFDETVEGDDEPPIFTQGRKGVVARL